MHTIFSYSKYIFRPACLVLLIASASPVSAALVYVNDSASYSVEAVTLPPPAAPRSFTVELPGLSDWVLSGKDAESKITRVETNFFPKDSNKLVVSVNLLKSTSDQDIGIQKFFV